MPPRMEQRVSRAARRGDLATQFLSAIDLDGPLEAALLLKRSGTPLAAWSRRGAPTDVATVMAATLEGSLETLVEAFGGPSTRAAFIKTGGWSIYVTKAEPQTLLLLAGPSVLPESFLKDEAERLLRRVSLPRTPAASRETGPGTGLRA